MRASHAAQIVDRLRQTPQGRHLLALPGHLLNSGWSAVVPGGVYLLGLNPGGSPGGGLSLEAQIGHTPATPRSAYNEAWGRPAGTHVHQLRVKQYLQTLGIADATVVPASNIYFPTAPDTRALAALAAQPPIRGMATLSQACWPVHEYLLELIRPRVILCLGNAAGEHASAFSALAARVPRQRWIRADTADYRRGKWFIAKTAFSEGQTVLVFGVPHPSRFPATAVVRRSLEEHARSVGWPPERAAAH